MCVLVIPIIGLDKRYNEPDCINSIIRRNLTGHEQIAIYVIEKEAVSVSGGLWAWRDRISSFSCDSIQYAALIVWLRDSLHQRAVCFVHRAEILVSSSAIFQEAIPQNIFQHVLSVFHFSCRTTRRYFSSMNTTSDSSTRRMSQSFDQRTILNTVRT